MDRLRPATAIVVATLALGACAASDSTIAEDVGSEATSAAVADAVEPAATRPPATALVLAATVPPTAPPATAPTAPPTVPATTQPPPPPPSPTVAPTTDPAPSTSPAAAAVPRPVAGTTPYVVPVADAASSSWADTHSSYPASDVFVDCGAIIVSPVNGAVLESRRINSYDPAVDNPATRGGRSVTILGDDGARYYLAHFESIDAGVEPGSRVAAGQSLGLMGQTGRASACHVHVGISPPCPGMEWSVRRGVIWPYPYLDDWRTGGQRSPADEVRAWLADNPDACAQAMADPFAADA